MPEDVAEEEKELFDLCALRDQDDDDNNGDDEEEEEEEEEEQQKHLRMELEEEEGVSKFQMSRRWLKKQQRSVSSSEEAIKQTWEKQRRDSMRRTTTSTTTRSRTRSLTDEDMDELRGCIDLGFGFSNDEEDPELCNTLPALELCYAITRQYNDVTGRSSSSPISTSGSSSSLDRCSSGSSLQSFPLESSWRISSPGDHPSQVKTRLRHWAQAVACTVRQSF
ncbi:unnamed protein product [Sphagnum balticum]